MENIPSHKSIRTSLMTGLSKSSGILENWLYSHANFLNVVDRLDITIDIDLECLHHGYKSGSRKVMMRIVIYRTWT
jgi:hypothetical protein